VLHEGGGAVVLHRRCQELSRGAPSLQMLLKPAGDEASGFRKDWLRFTDSKPKREGLNVYVLVDPANTKKKKSDWTAMWVIGLGRDKNYVVLDVLRDKLNLQERADALFYLVSTWKPLLVAYEEYGMQADIQFIRTGRSGRTTAFASSPSAARWAKRTAFASSCPCSRTAASSCRTRASEPSMTKPPSI
jgi:phage terminase large subunit-like protein